jgi:PAS domain S-box-containing protein
MKVSHKLILIILIGILIPTSIVTFINYNSSTRVITDILKDNLKNSVKQRINFVESSAHHLLKSLKIISEKRRLYQAFLDGNDKRMFQMLDPHARAHNFYDMFLINRDGTIEFTLKKESDLHENLYKKPLFGGKFSSAFIELMETQKETVANFSYYKPSTKYASFLLMPIFHDKKIVAVLAAQLDINMFVELSNDFSGLGESGEIIFAEKINNRAVFINKLRNDKGVIFKHSVKIGSENGLPIQKAVNGEFGSGIYHDYKDVEVIASWGYIESFKVGMVVKINTAEAYSKLAYLKNSALLMGVIVVLVMLYLVWYMKRMVEKLEMKRAQYEYAINGTNDGLWDWNLLKRTVYFSPQLKKMLGYEDDEFESSLESWKSVVHPDDLEEALVHIRKCHANPNEEYRMEYRVRHKDGSWIWILDRGKTVFEKGIATRMVGFHTDITENRNKELKIREVQRLLSNIINSIDTLIFVKDTNFHYLECNGAFAKFVGKSRDEVIGKSDYDLFNKNIANSFRVKDEAMLQNREPKANYEWVIYPNKKEVYFYTLKAPLYDEAGEVIGLVGNSVDMTESYNDKKALEEKEEIMIAQSRHAAMGEMISMIAHQWRQPISVISMDANNILVDIELESVNNDSLKNDVGDIIAQTKYLSKTIDDFRDFFKPSKIKDVVSVEDVFMEAFSVISKSLENNNIEVINEFKSETKLTLFSRELLQVFINILKNAKEALLEHKEENRIIRNKIYEEGEFVIISLCDNGGGIDDAIIHKIFEPYFTTKDAKNGTGLGLYMSKTIIEKHLKGSIMVFNNNEGVCFEIRLPKKDISEK